MIASTSTVTALDTKHRFSKTVKAQTFVENLILVIFVDGWPLELLARFYQPLGHILVPKSYNRAHGPDDRFLRIHETSYMSDVDP